jgi:hypothetical protein
MVSLRPEGSVILSNSTPGPRKTDWDTPESVPEAPGSVGPAAIDTLLGDWRAEERKA